MFCDEALDAVEAIASGDLTPEGRVAEHFTSCRQCAAALDSAPAGGVMAGAAMMFFAYVGLARPIYLVEEISSRWGAERLGGGANRVWFELTA